MTKALYFNTYVYVQIRTELIHSGFIKDFKYRLTLFLPKRLVLNVFLS